MSEEKSSEENFKQVEMFLYRILSSEARERLNNIKLVNLEKYMQIANILVKLVQSEKINGILSDADLKEILMQLNTKREFNIVRK
jgi:DNA-binding TFAR19-related protein (PDSD5 family)